MLWCWIQLSKMRPYHMPGKYRLIGQCGFRCKKSNTARPQLSGLRSRGTTKRSACNVLGDTSVRCVAEGNCMAARCALLCFLALARGIWVVMEQPRGSLLEHHPSMQLLFKICQFWRKSIKMGDFAAPSQKDTWLYSSLSPNCFIGVC